jgi:hypothetical protein
LYPKSATARALAIGKKYISGWLRREILATKSLVNVVVLDRLLDVVLVIVNVIIIVLVILVAVVIIVLAVIVTARWQDVPPC